MPVFPRNQKFCISVGHSSYSVMVFCNQKNIAVVDVFFLGKAKGCNVPDFGWRIALSHKFTEQPTAWTFPPLSQLPSLIGLALRYPMSLACKSYSIPSY